MISYEIIITPDAAEDLIELRDYIAHTLHSPSTAVLYIKSMRNEIKSLSTMPERNGLVDTEPWHSMGIRKILYKNFFIYYRVDSDNECVYILNVIYAKRDQLKFLTQIDFN